jgi:O-antigen ligase
MWHLAEKIYCILALVYFSAAIIPALMGQQIGSDALFYSNVRLLMLQIVVYAAMMVFLLLRFNRSTRFIFPDIWLVALLMWAVASVAWSGDPERTARKAILVCFSTLFGIYFGTCFTLRQQMRLLVISLGIIAVLSALCAVLLPEYGIAHDAQNAGAWMGVFTVKNQLGKQMAMMCICCVCLWLTHQARRSYMVFFFLLGVGLVVLSRSATSLVVLALSLSLVPFSRLLRSRTSTLIPAVFVLLLVLSGAVLLVVNNSATLLGLLGRDVTLTGRTGLWALVLMSISRHPFLGYGFAAFWEGMHGPSEYIRESLAWAPPHSHNGFLDLWLDLGLVGVILWGFAFFGALGRALRSFRKGEGYEGLWPIMLLSAFFLFNLTESVLLGTYSFWVLFAAATVHPPRTEGMRENDKAFYRKINPSDAVPGASSISTSANREI